MPNALGSVNSGGEFELVAPLFDPRMATNLRDHYRRPAIDVLARANSLCMPAGRPSARAWCLVRRVDYQEIDPYSTDLVLAIQDYEGSAGGLLLRGLTVVQARCVTTGRVDDDDSLYLVELTDARGILKNEWFTFPTTSQYNVVAPAYPGEYYELSTDGGVAWTWETMIEDLWDQMGTFLGPFPGLPSVPEGTPENWVFPGRGAWDALCDILDHIGMQVACDLTLENPYTIAEIGGDDAAFDALTLQYLGRLEDDLSWLDVGSGRFPMEVVVYFHRRNEFYGTEETIRMDDLQWQSTPLYSVTVPAPAQFADAVGTHFLWDDFTVRYDEDNSPLGADTATAATIAAERVQQYYNAIYRGTVGYMNRVYAGTLPFVASGKVDMVAWKADPAFRLGWRTEVLRGATPSWLGGDEAANE